MEFVARGGYGQILKLPNKTCIKKFLQVYQGKCFNFNKELYTYLLLDKLGKNHEHRDKVINLISYDLLDFTITMEFFGVSLYEYQKEHILDSEDNKLEIITQVLQGVAFLSSCGLVHGDLTPNNILVVCGGCYQCTETSGKNLVKICDLGSVLVENYTQQNFVCPKAIEPPEISLYFSNKTDKFDVWCAGLVLLSLVDKEYLNKFYNYRKPYDKLLESKNFQPGSEKAIITNFELLSSDNEYKLNYDCLKDLYFLLQEYVNKMNKTRCQQLLCKLLAVDYDERPLISELVETTNSKHKLVEYLNQNENLRNYLNCSF